MTCEKSRTKRGGHSGANAKELPAVAGLHAVLPFYCHPPCTGPVCASFGELIHAIEIELMEMDVEFDRAAEALDQRDHAGLGLSLFEA